MLKTEGTFLSDEAPWYLTISVSFIWPVVCGVALAVGKMRPVRVRLVHLAHG